MVIVDPADPSTWPAAVLAEVEHLAAECRGQDANTSSSLSYELSLGHPDASHAAEARFRQLLDGTLVALFHATRLLHHERESIRREGLFVLTEERRSRRLDRVIEIYGDRIEVERLELLRRSGPLSWSRHHRDARLGRLHGVTPLQVAFDEGGSGMTIFLSRWGGESFYWAGEESDDLKATIDLLTDLSMPAIVEVGVPSNSLNTYTYLWPVFVAQLDGWPQPWHEFSTRESVPPARVLDIIDSTSDRWPLPATAPAPHRGAKSSQ